VATALELDELVEHFTLVGDELELLRNKTGATRLAFALFLKYLPWKGRFPRGRSELADNVIEHVARQVDVAPRSSASATGPGGRPSASGWRSAVAWAFGSAAGPTPTSSPGGWRSTWRRPSGVR